MAARWFGYNVPFLQAKAVLQPQYDERLIRNDWLLLLLTSPGERRGRPDFGTILRKFPFEHMDEDSFDKLRNNIKQATIKFEPRINFKKINVRKDPSGTAANVQVFGALTDASQKEISVSLKFPFRAA